jgi:hypothetical protein
MQAAAIHAATSTASEHAERILDAWRLANPAMFESELDQALATCRHNSVTSSLELEQQELLATSAESLRNMSAAHYACRPARLAADFALLHHLQSRAAYSQAA